MEFRACGSHELMLPKLGIGCWAFGGADGDYWGAQDDQEAQHVVHSALDQGAVYMDTAEMYNEGRSEIALGRYLGNRRSQAIIGSKVLPVHASYDLLRQHCDASLRRLNTSMIDLYMLHWPVTEFPIEQVFIVLAELQREGKIRHLGVSNFGVKQLQEAVEAADKAGTRIMANQLCYNLLSRAIEYEIIPECQKFNIGVLGYMPLQQGLLSGKYYSADDLPVLRTRTRHFDGRRPLSRHGEPGAETEVFQAINAMRVLSEETGIPMSQMAIYWASNQPGITCTITGVRNQAQLNEALAGVTLAAPVGLLDRLTEITEPVKAKLGSNADYFQGGENARVH